MNTILKIIFIIFLYSFNVFSMEINSGKNKESFMDPNAKLEKLPNCIILSILNFCSSPEEMLCTAMALKNTCKSLNKIITPKKTAFALDKYFKNTLFFPENIETIKGKKSFFDSLNTLIIVKSNTKKNIEETEVKNGVIDNICNGITTIIFAPKILLESIYSPVKKNKNTCTFAQKVNVELKSMYQKKDGNFFRCFTCEKGLLVKNKDLFDSCVSCKKEDNKFSLLDKLSYSCNPLKYVLSFVKEKDFDELITYFEDNNQKKRYSLNSAIESKKAVKLWQDIFTTCDPQLLSKFCSTCDEDFLDSLIVFFVTQDHSLNENFLDIFNVLLSEKSNKNDTKNDLQKTVMAISCGDGADNLLELIMTHEKEILFHYLIYKGFDCTKEASNKKPVINSLARFIDYPGFSYEIKSVSEKVDLTKEIDPAQWLGEFLRVKKTETRNSIVLSFLPKNNQDTKEKMSIELSVDAQDVLKNIIKYNLPHLVKYFQFEGNNYLLLVEMVKKNYVEIVKEILNKYDNDALLKLLMEEDLNKQSAVFYAIENGSFDMIKLLLKFDPDLFKKNITDGSKRSPLELINYLLEDQRKHRGYFNNNYLLIKNIIEENS